LALYDRIENKIVVRVVYDGAARSGKTTNVTQVCKMFTVRRRGEVFVPEESGGRTQFFDWLRLDGGLVGGFPLRCQLVTVPGQYSLRHRRESILRSADVVVFVVDSSSEGMIDALDSFTALQSLHTKWKDEEGYDPPPLVIQANKQDLEEAVPVATIREKLGVADAVEIVEAAAEMGSGVREALVLAIRCAADLVSERLIRDGVEVLEGVPESPEELYKALQLLHSRDTQMHGIRVDPPAASQILSPIAQVSVAASMTEAMSDTEEKAPPAAALAEGTSEVQKAPEAVENETAGIEEDDESAKQPWESKPVAAEPAAAENTEVRSSEESTPSKDSSLGSARDRSPTIPNFVTPETLALAEPEPEPEPESKEVPETQAKLAGRSTVPVDELGFPDPMVPTGFIWPGNNGRNIVRELLMEERVFRHDLVGRHGGVDGSGRSDILLYQAGNWLLKSSPAKRFTEVDEAKNALLELARKKVMLGDMLLPDTVLTLAIAPDGGLWLWTVTPLVTTLRAAMISADRSADEEALGQALESYADATVASLRLMRDRDAILDIHPGNFAYSEDNIVYIDDDISVGNQDPMIGYLMLQRIAEYEHRPAAVDRYIVRLEEGLRKNLSPRELRDLEVSNSIEAAPTRSSAVREAQVRLVRTITGFRADRR
jgi:signal recognition particle receptor subunit beta